MAKNSFLDWDTTASNNTDVGGIGILGTNAVNNFDDALRTIMAQLRSGAQSALRARVDVASASTTDIGAASSEYVNITGTTTITSFGTAPNGTWRNIRFDAALTLTHNGTSLVLPNGGVNIVTAAGDHCVAVSRGGGNWDVVDYQRAAGTALFSPGATTSAQGVVELATAAEVAAGTDTARVPSVASMASHQGVAKAWVNFNGTGTVAIRDSYNVSSITDGGTGQYTVNFASSMASANYAAITSAAGAWAYLAGAYSASAVSVSMRDGAGALFDSSIVNVAIFGD